PSDGLALIVAVLVGLPLVFLSVAVSRLSSGARRRRAAALHLLGMPARSLAVAGAVESGIHTAIGAVLGLTSAALSAFPLARSGVLGMSWFPQDTPIVPWPALLIGGSVTTLASVVAARAAHRAARESLSARRGQVRTPRGVARLLPGMIGIGVLIGFVVARTLSSGANLSSGPMAIVAVVGMVAATGGSAASLDPLLAGMAKRLPGTRRSVAVHLAARRLAFDASPNARAGMAIVVLMVTGMVGMGVLTDVAAQNKPRAAGHTVWVSTPSVMDPQVMHDLLAVPAGATALQFSSATGTDKSQSADQLVATCQSLAAFAAAPGVGPVTARTGEELGKQCRDKQRLRVVDSRSTPSSDPVVPGDVLDVANLDSISILGGIRELTTDEPSLSAPRGLGGVLFALPGPTEQDAERYVSQVLGVMPTAKIGYGDVTTTASLYRPVFRLTLSCLVTGLLVGVLAFSLVALDRFRERAQEVTALRALGVPRAVMLRAEIAQQFLAISGAAGLGACVGWLAGQAYLAMAGTDSSFTVGTWVLACLTAAAMLMSGLVATITTLLVGAEINPEFIRNE
ncbi:MAG TPA: hypothetical protein VFP72_02845, partial [Kineosporiaceae bacterium]|nr:hypothetical protein [Kineosporiaceae bacterium]